jgi:hypothetical protein
MTVTPNQMIARMREIGITGAYLRPGDQVNEHPAGPLPDGSLAIVYENDHPDTDGGPDIPMAEPLSVAIFTPEPDGSVNEPDDCFGPLTPGQAIDVLLRCMDSSIRDA